MIPERTIAHISEDPETPKTQLIIVTGLLVLAAIFDSEMIAYTALLVGLVSLIVPMAGNRIVWGWYKLAQILGYVNARILLSLIYYLLVTPIAFFFRLSGNDPLILKRPERSAYLFRDYKFKKKDLVNPW